MVIIIRYLTSGESHGKCLNAIIEGIPANFTVDIDRINFELHQRGSGYGRSNRMNIENDTAQILSGIRGSKTLGSPICIQINNKDWKNYIDIMDTINSEGEPLAVPRPGHADLAGLIKYNQNDIRNILERASARQTAVTVAVGSIVKQILEHFNIIVIGYVISIGSAKIDKIFQYSADNINRIYGSNLRCFDQIAEDKMTRQINTAKQKGDTLGGIFEVRAIGVPIGLGSFMHYDRRLDARLSSGLMSIPSVKAVEFGLGRDLSIKFGSQVQDEIFYKSNRGFYRKTNYLGGIEGGISNGQPIVARAYMKPIPTVAKPLKSVNIMTKETADAITQRSDVCAVPAGSVIGEAVAAWEIASAFLEKFGGDSMEEVEWNFKKYLDYIRKR